MAKSVTNPPLASGKGKTIFFASEELVHIDDALCRKLYLPDSDGEFNPDLSPETQKLICHIIDKINRHI